jgi:hypothetical protein
MDKDLELLQTKLAALMAAQMLGHALFIKYLELKGEGFDRIINKLFVENYPIVAKKVFERLYVSSPVTEDELNKIVQDFLKQIPGIN